MSREKGNENVEENTENHTIFITLRTQNITTLRIKSQKQSQV